MKPVYTKLPWDSEFFSYHVGKISGVIENLSDLEDAANVIAQNQGKLTYFSSKTILGDFKESIDGLEVILVDKKTTFIKPVDPTKEMHPSVSTYANPKHHPKLFELAVQSGIYSRFNVDSRIGKDKFEEMYRLWMANSINKTIAKEILIYEVDGEIAGFLTLGEKNNRADLGIMAVESQYRGMGIARAFMNSADNWFGQHGYDSMQVVTQGDNLPACSLYLKYGFLIESVEYYYHLWMD